jgi:ribonucleoside-diphosphate reductase alpha chain
VEKSTLKGTDGKLNAVSSAVSAMTLSAANGHANGNSEVVGKACVIDDPTCEACQ